MSSPVKDKVKTGNCKLRKTANQMSYEARDYYNFAEAHGDASRTGNERPISFAASCVGLCDMNSGHAARRDSHEHSNRAPPVDFGN